MYSGDEFYGDDVTSPLFRPLPLADDDDTLYCERCGEPLDEDDAFLVNDLNVCGDCAIGDECPEGSPPFNGRA